MRRGRAGLTTTTLLIGALLAPGCGGQDDVIVAPDCGGTNLVAFASDRSGRSQIFLYDTQLGGYRLLRDLDDGVSPDRDPAITRDARYLAFERTGAASGSDLLIYDRCAAAISPQGALNSAGDDVDPAFTGDGFKLAFARDTLSDLRIRLLDGQSDRLVPLPGIDAAPGFGDRAPSPDQAGNLIAFVSNRNGNDDVFVYDAAGDALFTLPDLVSPEEDTDPWLTPDGRWLAFASSRAGGAGGLDLYLYDLQTRTFATLLAGLNTDQVERHPALSSDANVVVFSSNRGASQGMDVWIHLRSTGDLVRPAGAASAADEIDTHLSWR